MLFFYHPDLVLMDVDIPLLNGCESISRIKQIDSNANIVIITGHIQPESDCVSVTEKYSIQFLVKPIVLSDILKLVQKPMLR